jgi:GNAT superfamily N-acetyltransferase
MNAMCRPYTTHHRVKFIVSMLVAFRHSVPESLQIKMVHAFGLMPPLPAFSALSQPQRNVSTGGVSGQDSNREYLRQQRIFSTGGVSGQDNNREYPTGPPSVEYRLLGPGEHDVLANVDPDVFDNPVNPEFAAEYLSNPSCLLVVALEHAEVVGMASGLVYVHPDQPRQLFIYEVGVADKCQRRGIASELVSQLLARGKELGCCQAWVATEESNAPARALYTSLRGAEEDDHAVVFTWKL